MRIPFVYDDSTTERYLRRLRLSERRYRQQQRESQRQTFAARDGETYVIDPGTYVLTRIA